MPDLLNLESVLIMHRKGVVVDANYRDRKWGHDLMRNHGIASHYGESKITIGAQLYLKKFYESHGFYKLVKCI
jgi:predicted GNAT family N-acyltransferase